MLRDDLREPHLHTIGTWLAFGSPLAISFD
jgi:hypothetical protein